MCDKFTSTHQIKIAETTKVIWFTFISLELTNSEPTDLHFFTSGAGAKLEEQA